MIFLCRLLILFKINFFDTKKSRIPSVSNSLDSDRSDVFIGPGLGPNCLRRLSAESADDSIMGKDQYRSKTASSPQNIFLF